jgi:N-acetylglucosamine kinase-like BadF-type ATPase
VAVTEAGEICADFEVAGADLPTRGEHEVARVLRELRFELEERFEAGDRVGGVALGLPGYGETPTWSAALESLAESVFADLPHRVYNDVRFALEGALPGEPGVIVLSGTGSMAWGKREDGTEARTGGWGALLGDEGSAFDIGVGALRMACKAADGRGEKTALAMEIPASFGVSDMNGVLEVLSESLQLPRAQVAALARLVDELAGRGDGVSLRLLEAAAKELEKHVVAITERLELPFDIPIAFAGGSFKSAFLKDALTRRLNARGFHTIVEPRFSPAYGGSLLAKKLP